MKQREQKAYAKINLALDVTGRREDGYHLVDMIMNQVDLWDTVRMETEESIGEFMRKEKIFLSISGADLAADSTNLAWKAAECIGEIWKQKNNTEIPAVRIFIKKRIPMAAGLAGGSADCAAVLLGLNALWNLQLSLEELMEIGLRLGRWSLCQGRGYRRKIDGAESAVSLGAAGKTGSVSFHRGNLSKIGFDAFLVPSLHGRCCSGFGTRKSAKSF